MSVLETTSDSLALHAADRRHVWHPFTQMQEYGEVPVLAIASGQGGWLTDTEGRTYLDGNASIWTNVHGHNDPGLNAALIRQLGRMAHSTMLGLTHSPGTELAAELAGLAPAGLGRVFFTDNGAGAVEVALKLSFQYWQLAGRPEKRGVIGLAGGYHGDTFEANGGGKRIFSRPLPPLVFPVLAFSRPPLPRTGRADLGGRRLGESGRTAPPAGGRGEPDGLPDPGTVGAGRRRHASAAPGLRRRGGRPLPRPRGASDSGRGVRRFRPAGPDFLAGAEVVPDFLCTAKGLTAGYLPLPGHAGAGGDLCRFPGAYEPSGIFSRPYLCRQSSGGGGGAGEHPQAPAASGRGRVGERIAHFGRPPSGLWRIAPPCGSAAAGPGRRHRPRAAEDGTPDRPRGLSARPGARSPAPVMGGAPPARCRRFAFLWPNSASWPSERPPLSTTSTPEPAIFTAPRHPPSPRPANSTTFR